MPAASGRAISWRPWLGRIALLLAFFGLRELYLRHGKPTEEAYFDSVLLLGALRHPPFLLALILPSLLPVSRWRELRWRAVPDGPALRIAVGVVCLSLAWALSTYDFNLYFGRGHLADRLLVAGLAIAVWFHPSAVPAFLAALLAVAAQFEHPFGGFSWTDKILPIEILIAFVLYLQLRALRREGSATFVLLALLVTVGHYAYPAYAKVRSLWPLRDDLASLSASCHMHGWLADVDDGSFNQLLFGVRRLNPLLLGATLAIEASSVLLLFVRRAYRVVLPACALLHLGIFAASGIFFWKWIVTDVALGILLARLDGATLAEVYGPRLRGFAVLALLTVKPWLDPSSLTWYDTPLTYCFELEATGRSGGRYRVPRAFLAPYDLAFAQNRFWFLSADPLLVQTFGTTQDPAVAQGLASATPADIERLEAGTGNRFDPEKAERFDRFVRAFFARSNQRDRRRTWLDRLAAPHHIWLQAAGDDVYAGQEPVVEIQVVREKRYWDGRSFLRLSSDRLRSIPIPDDP